MFHRCAPPYIYQIFFSNAANPRTQVFYLPKTYSSLFPVLPHCYNFLESGLYGDARTPNGPRRHHSPLHGPAAEQEGKMWNTSRFCMSSLHRDHANFLCIVPIFVYVLPKGLHTVVVSTHILPRGKGVPGVKKGMYEVGHLG